MSMDERTATGANAASNSPNDAVDRASNNVADNATIGAMIDAASRANAAARTALLGQGAVIIWNDIAPEGRNQFYEWHDKEHMPERLSIPGFRRGRRFIRPGHSPEWLTVYEADDIGVVTSPAYLARLNAPTPLSQSSIKYFLNTSRAVCRLVHTTGSSTGGHMLALRLNVPEGGDDALLHLLAGVAFPRAMQRTGVVACHLFRGDDSASNTRTAENKGRTIDIPSWILLCEATLASAAEAAQPIFLDALASLGVTARPDATTYALEHCRLSQPQG
jgi:hypothetical protein